ncbi:major surface protease gp63, putative [Leishmania tarentolae]|uniref:Major surface protease gp63, putative n=1 Tax=Leishmania tarentolae TaxID=5689 RepID=A0A640KWI1_LEITA|nr:major surface protease gp63, putative [Leishmania tarentolae]GET94023.1 major surface protease gp63, putative [Leishmania tarentolae]
MVIPGHNVCRGDVDDAHGWTAVGERLADHRPRQHARLARHGGHIQHEVGVA